MKYFRIYEQQLGVGKPKLTPHNLHFTNYRQKLGDKEYYSLDELLSLNIGITFDKKITSAKEGSIVKLGSLHSRGILVAKRLTDKEVEDFDECISNINKSEEMVDYIQKRFEKEIPDLWKDYKSWLKKLASAKTNFLKIRKI